MICELFRMHLGSGFDDLGSGFDHLGSGFDHLGSGFDDLGSGFDDLGNGFDNYIFSETLQGQAVCSNTLNEKCQAPQERSE